MDAAEKLPDELCDSSASPLESCELNEQVHLHKFSGEEVLSGSPYQTVDKVDKISIALSLRRQPLMELVSSEEGYVRRLRMVRDSYMPVISITKSQSSPDSTTYPITVSSPTPLKDLQSPASNLPSMPDDLAARWRIVWGNWIQLCEWHSTFLEKISMLVDSDPDKIPRLFIDSRARLRSIYSKYCENHRKAALIADQHRDYFEELRAYLNDKEDVVSYLIQPVQRIMRYQLPMAEIVKFTERARLPELALWQKALDIMKEIPKDTQLILEAARIDGFPGVITALGNILIRGNLLVATSTCEQLLEAVAGYKSVLKETSRILGISDPSSPHSKTPSVRAHAGRSATPTSSLSSNDPVSPSLSAVISEIGHTSESSGLYVGNLKFVESRLFLFEQMLVVTEEVKPKRRALSNEAFAQSTFQFRAAINVNKMRFEPHWYNCSLPNGLANADANAVDHLLSFGVAPEDLRFAVQDQTPGRNFIYVIDPTTLATREAWVVQLRDIQRMQQEFLLALQDPRRFNTGNRDDTWDVFSSTDSCHPPHSDSHPPLVAVQKNVPATQTQRQRQQKWPSFTMRRAARLGSASSPNSKKSFAAPPQQLPSPTSTLYETTEERLTGNLLSRSLSAERGSVLRTKSELRSSICDSKVSHVSGSGTTAHRKSSLNDIDHTSVQLHDVAESFHRDGSTGESKGGSNVVKMRNVFANLFGRNKSKHRSKANVGHHAVPVARTQQHDESMVDPSDGCQSFSFSNIDSTP